jgi:large subunit ribosomal protein L21|tara:strand:+ start:85002 stop:85346 length:345 start_codon:yes stop_codon:yes gene_type:complete
MLICLVVCGGNLMFAVLITGGKQYKVSKGDRINIEKIDGDIGSNVVLEQILMTGKGEKVQIGTPFLENKKVSAKILSHDKAPKVLIQKHKPRKNSRKRTGHRQQFTTLEITSIS